MEITRHNISSHLDEIVKNIKTCNFVTFDAEFTGLNVNDLYKNSAAKRYTNLRKGTDGIAAVQVGISAFHFSRNENAYRAATYNFELCPQAIGSINQCFTFEASALQFLSNHNFDFNKIMYEGIPYLNQHEEEILKNDIEMERIESNLDFSGLDQMFLEETKVKEWASSSEKNSLTVAGFPCFCYILTKKIRNRFPKLKVVNHGYEVEISKEKNDPKSKNSKSVLTDEEKLLKLATGFCNVVKELIKAKKPLVLHNALTDLLIFSNQFVEPLPSRYESFKNHLHEMFPMVFDTKYISNEMKFLVKKEEFSESTCLEKLYDFFKDCKGRNLAFHSPLVKMMDGFNHTPHFHQAGWDSFSTGYCFVRLCHWAASNKFGVERAFTSTEHFSAMNKYVNKIYLSRASQPHICLDQDDPSKHRPEYLFIETLGSEKINICQVANSLSQFGSIDVRQHGKTSALVAVTHKICARKILYEFKQNKSWNIAEYSVLKHSRAARLALWSGVVASGVSLLALIYHRVK